MRGAAKKVKEPVRQTRSRPLRPLRAKPAAPVKKATSPSKQATPPAKQATSPAKQATTPAKQATTPAKPARKTCKDKEEPVNHEPIQVVPGNMKKNQNPKKKTEPKMGVESGKVGKRKTKLTAKKDIIKKLSSKMENKLENVLNTLLEVASNTAVKKSDPKIAEKAKKKKLEKEKDTNKKEKTEKKVKEEKKGKEEKPSKEPAKKKAKVLQKDTKNSKKGIKRDKESKGLKGGLKEIIEVETEIKEEIKKERELSIEDRGVIIQERTEIKVELVKVKEEKDQIIESRNVITENIAVERKKKIMKGESKSKSKPTVKETKKTGKAKGKNDNVKVTGQKGKLEKVSPATVKEVDKVNDTKDVAARKGKKNEQEKKSDKKPKNVKVVKKKRKAPIAKNIKKAKVEKKEDLLILEKRHREASLNALAKVHCLYENESKGAMNEILNNSKRKSQVKSDSENEDIEEEEEKPSRNLRTTPGMRSVGRHWEVFDASLSSSSPSPASTTSEEEVEEEQEEEVEEVPVKREEEPKEVEKPEEVKPKTRKRRKRNELTMDLKDMVVRKRMASLNASAMMAATYSMEKRSKSDDKRKSQRSSDESSSSVVTESSEDEVGLISNKKGVTVLVNQQDSTSDVTITGFCTSRSTRHEGFCSFAGMQYRISSTSHTQTEATAVSSETVIHTTDVSVSHSESSGSVVESGGGTSPGGSCKSYTPLGALSSMQPPGQGRPCGSSAFSAPPYLPHHQEHAHGYYQPAGPLISQHGAPLPKPGSPEPPPPYPTAAYSAPYPPAGYSDYPGYYRGYRRPWHPGPSQMMADYMEPPYPPHPNYYPYPPPPPPPPPCYAAPVRGLPFIDPSYQPCPCPLQSCPKNVHTGPLTGASKGSGGSEAQNSEVGAPLPPPVALALPLEPVGASLGPPSPARGSAALMQPLTHDILSSVDGDDAGMPPPCSPALSTARNTSWSPPAPALLQPITPEPLTNTVVEEGLQVGQLPAAPIALPKRKMKKEENQETEQQQLQHQQPRKRRRHSVMMSAKNNKARGKPSGGVVVTVVKTEPEEAEEALCVIPPRRLQPTLRWSNGWSWEGEAYLAPVYLSTDVNPVKRRCYPGMRHMEGDLLKCRDCVLLKPPGPKKQQLPFVAKISQLWEDPEDGEMMVSLMWYYRPEHTEQGRQPSHSPDEVFASRHRDVNSVACIEDRCYVMTFNEYCRYQKMLRLKRDGRHIVPDWTDDNPRKRYTPQSKVATDLVFFCRKIYDFRLKKVPKRPPPNI